MKYTTLSLFTGAGGLDLGLQSTDRFELIADVENDAACCETLRVNHEAGRLGAAGFRVFETDVVALDPHRLMTDLQLQPGTLDLLVGGPPCQPFSSEGARRGVQDPRGLLPWHLLAFVRTLRPRVFAMENVLGFCTSRTTPTSLPGSVLQEFLRDIPTEYRVTVFTVNAADYGLAQHRRRVFIVGTRLGRTPILPPPTHGPGRQPYRTLRDVLAGLEQPNPVGVQYSPKRQAVLEQVPPGGNWRTLAPRVAEAAMGRAYHRKPGSNWYRRLPWDAPAPTLITHPASNRMGRCHPDETRPLSVAEYRRIQGFPDSWELCGSLTAQYRQLGNAVPPVLGRVVGEMVAAMLDAGATPNPGGHNPQPPKPPTWHDPRPRPPAVPRREPPDHGDRANPNNPTDESTDPGGPPRRGKQRLPPLTPQTPIEPERLYSLPEVARLMGVDDCQPSRWVRRSAHGTRSQMRGRFPIAATNPRRVTGATIIAFREWRQSRTHEGVILAVNSMNAKLGRASATYVARQSCPASCPFQREGCYAEHDNTRSIWDGITRGSEGVLPLELAHREAALIDDVTAPTRDLRLHVAGDSTTTEGTLRLARACARYVERARTQGHTVKVWAYTHGHAVVPREAWGSVNILASCESAEQCKVAMERGYAAALVVEEFPTAAAYQLGGVKVLPCPQQTRGKTCTECRLCMNDARLLKSKLAIGFAIHGWGSKKASAALRRVSLPMVT